MRHKLTKTGLFFLKSLHPATEPPTCALAQVSLGFQWTSRSPDWMLDICISSACSLEPVTITVLHMAQYTNGCNSIHFHYPPLLRSTVSYQCLGMSLNSLDQENNF